ncbi:MAG TPA: biotin/lipoyl-binding protein [Clostridiaceae bacterium]|nr:biotin/lipoyl-binding protein [Clostridiaceae bacterium]
MQNFDMKKFFLNYFQEKYFKIIIISLIVLSYLVIFSGCYFFPQEEEVLAPPLKEPQKIEYKTIKVQRGTIEKRINGTAYFVSDLQTDVYFTERGGRIKSINVKNGDMVNEGDVLIELETDDLEKQIFQQELNLERLKLNTSQTLSNLERAIKLSEMELEDLKENLAEINTIIENLGEGVKLQDIMPNVDVKEIEDQIKRKEFLIEGQKLEYENYKASAELDIKTIELQIENLKNELAKTKLVSPVSGKIVWLTSAKPGDVVYTYSNLVRIADVNRLKLKYSGDNLSDFKIGATVEVKIDDKDYVGRVVMIPSTAPFDADDSLRRSVLIEVENLPSSVKLGDPARISFLIDRKENVIVIPRNMLHGIMGQKTVYVLEDGLKKDRTVETGLENATEVEIVKGLEEGEEIIEG